MLRKFFGMSQKRGQDPRSSSVPHGLRIYAIGDIHGRVDLLKSLHKKISEDAKNADPDTRKIAIYLGDYVDRGDHSKEVLDLLIDEPLEGFESVFLKGNHEEMLCHFVEDASVGLVWLAYGGDACIYSYKVPAPNGTSKPEEVVKIQRSLQSVIPDSHMEFLNNLMLSYEVGDYYFVHAGVNPDQPLFEQGPASQMWIREEFINDPRFHGKVIVHGHTITETPDIMHNRIGIDTGAYYSGTLTCLVLENDEKRFITT